MLWFEIIYIHKYINELCIKLKISAFQGKEITPSFSWALSKESKRMLVVFDRNICGFWHSEHPVYTSRNVCIKFQISNFRGKGPTPGFSRASSKCHPWSLRGHCWFLRWGLVVFDLLDVQRIHQGNYISIFRSLPSWKAIQLLGSPECHQSVIHGI